MESKNKLTTNIVKKFSGLIFKGKAPIVVAITLSLALGICATQLTKETVKSEASTITKVSIVKKEKVEINNSEKENLNDKKENVLGEKELVETTELVMPVFNNEFIDRLKEDTVAVSKDYGLYPSVMMAQAIIESDWGRSGLSVNANNFFGVKAIKGQNHVVMPTQEDDGKGNLYWINDAFAKYDNLYDSMEGNALVLYNNYKLYHGAFRANTTSYKDATLWLTGRYATATNYNTVLNSVIEEYGLYRLDAINPIY